MSQYFSQGTPELSGSSMPAFYFFPHNILDDTDSDDQIQIISAYTNHLEQKSGQKLWEVAYDAFSGTGGVHHEMHSKKQGV